MVSRIIQVRSFDLVVFGATGDLAHRKIFPALYNRLVTGQMPEDAMVIGVGRQKMSTNSFRKLIKESLNKYLNSSLLKEEIVKSFLECVQYISLKSIASEVVLLDIKEGLAEGKALDLSQTSTTLGFNTRIIGATNDFSVTSGSDVVVITSGVPRKPGMTREELIGINAGIVQSVANSILEHSPKTGIVVVSNPRQTIT